MNVIYTRQSVDKKDSISIESQIEICKRKLLPSEESNIKIYTDKGFSGKSTNRPGFQGLMDDIRNGHVEKIIVYKVDRISRSLLDFLKMQEVFRQFNIKFVSCLEDFDTSSSTGKMMMNMLMMFAEMEREAIQKRITDNYYSRGERGFYLGGYAPFGYIKIDTILDGKKTYTFKIDTHEAEIVKSIYEDYTYNRKSLNEIARRLNSLGIKTKRNSNWNMQGVSRTLHNPVYVKANTDVYTYLKSRGATMNNQIEDYIGENGCYVYGNAQERKSKFTYLDTDFVTLGLHPGIVDSNLWLLTQNRFKQQRFIGNLGSGKLSWAQGLVKCKYCGFSCYVKKYRNSEHGRVFLYFYCRGKRNGTCKSSKKMLRVEVLEAALENEIHDILRREKYEDKANLPENDVRLNDLKIEQALVESKITALVSQIELASRITMKYINEELERLDIERSRLNGEIVDYQLSTSVLRQSIDIDDVLVNWNSYSIDEKSALAKALVKKIEIDGDEIEIII